MNRVVERLWRPWKPGFWQIVGGLLVILLGVATVAGLFGAMISLRRENLATD